MNTPDHASDSQIARLVEGEAVNPETIFHRPVPDMLAEIRATHETTAQWLFRRFKAGSMTLGKLDAYRIANELERVTAERDQALEAGAQLVKEIAALAVKP